MRNHRDLLVLPLGRKVVNCSWRPIWKERDLLCFTGHPSFDNSASTMFISWVGSQEVVARDSEKFSWKKSKSSKILKIVTGQGAGAQVLWVKIHTVKLDRVSNIEHEDRVPMAKRTFT